MPLLAASTATYTHAGRRRTNQDAVAVQSLGNAVDLVVLADGMGGHSAGEVASTLALEVLASELQAGSPLTEAVRAANGRVHASSHENSDWQGMGTTLVALLRSGAHYEIANVGDSRAYRIETSAIRQITQDHSYIAEAMRGGVMTAEEATRSPWRNALTRAIGTDAVVEVDVFGPFPVDEPHAVLLCSDGLYKAVSDEIIREYILSVDDLPAAVETLAALAYRRGSDDNISIAAVEFGSLSRRAPLVTLPLPIRLQPAKATVPSKPAPRAAPASAETVERRPTPAPTAHSLPQPESPRRRSRKRERRRRALRLLTSVLVFLTALVAFALWLTA